jgi:ferritin
MVATLLYETETEKRQHLSAIHVLSIDLGVAEDCIKQLYENELKVLKEHARINDYLSVLVMKRIKGKIR